MTRLLLGAASVATIAASYQSYAIKTGRVPTISELGRGFRHHFRPCPNYPNCRATLVPRPRNTPRPYGTEVWN